MIDNIIRRAVLTPSGLRGVGRSEGIDVEVRGKGVEHGTRFASLQEENEFAVRLLLVKSLQSTLHLLSGDSAASAAYTSFITMVTVVDEESILLGGVEHLGILHSSQLLHLLLILREDSQNDLRLDVLGSVIIVLLALGSMVPARSLRIGKGEQLAGPGVLLIGVNQLVSHVNDVVLRNAGSNQILWIKLQSYTYIISTAGVTGVGIVSITSVSLEDNGVLIGENNRKKGKSENQSFVHLAITYKKDCDQSIIMTCIFGAPCSLDKHIGSPIVWFLHFSDY